MIPIFLVVVVFDMFAMRMWEGIAAGKVNEEWETDVGVLGLVQALFGAPILI